jgi:hypothetical protein
VNDATLSVIIPAHNAAATLEALVEACLSLLPRSFADIEIIIVDDGSSDDTPRLAVRLAAAHDAVVVLHQRSRGGFGVALAHGAGAARGDYIAVLAVETPRAADDLLRLAPALSGAAVVTGVPQGGAAPAHDGWLQGAEHGPLVARADALRALAPVSRSRQILPEIVYRARRAGLAVEVVGLPEAPAPRSSLAAGLERLRLRSQIDRGEGRWLGGPPWQVKALAGGALAALLGGAWVALRRR